MRYHYEKPEIYLSMYGKVYFCDHPVYHCCTLFQIGEKGLAIIQQRFDEKRRVPGGEKWTHGLQMIYICILALKDTLICVLEWLRTDFIRP